MTLNATIVRPYLKDFDFDALFRNELGWDNLDSSVGISADDETFTLDSIAEKRGMVAFTCTPMSDGHIPDYAMRRKIERQIAKSVLQHIVIYVDESKTTQIWQWVRREMGKPTACREHQYHCNQPGDALIQKLEAIAFSLSEEETLSHLEVVNRARAAFDVEKITKRFYDRFKAEHDVFLGFLHGIPDEGMQRWYVSVMLNRLMFIYFIQKKGFLDGDTDYLRKRLEMIQQVKGKDKFQSFYRYFLLHLFHDGLGKSPDERKLDPVLERLLGKVPFLNGGFFEVHEVEQQYPEIDIPDKAFEKLFDFFDQYSWHLDVRPFSADNEINPDVVGYIFEKYINQKQMGAYYTKEDITDYISKNTIIPFLFDSAEKEWPIAFKPYGTVWLLLCNDPDRYIYPAVRYGVIRDDSSIVSESELPEFVQANMQDPKSRMHDNRYNLQQAPADDPIRLVTETWREYVSRRTRCLEIREKLRKGEIHLINDFITLNLDIWQFCRDAIINAEGPELLRAFWHAIEKITVLDPACGSGAFLFAALRILETLFSDCIERMKQFIEDISNKPRPFEQYGDFKRVLDQIAMHPNERYFILKFIIINNLFGVDIMEEAVEICKLRLFLKLVAQVEKVSQIEPLPDIDFNIRAGNTLVGYATVSQVRKAFTEESTTGTITQMKLMLCDEVDDYKRFEDSLIIVDEAFQKFRDQQTAHGGKVIHEDKLKLRRHLEVLNTELDRYLAREYCINIERQKEFDAWKASHKPFHWFVEFYRIMREGGFDVIIGNPPYIVFSENKIGYTILSGKYKTFPTKNLYAFMFERSVNLAQPGSPVGLIVQLTAISSMSLTTLQDLLSRRGHLVAISFPRRPESIFEGVEMPVAILLSLGSAEAGSYLSSRVNRFYTKERPTAIARLRLTKHHNRLHGHRIAKFGTELEQSIYEKLAKGTLLIDSLTRSNGGGVLFYQEACRYWLKAFDRLPYFTRNGKRTEPPHGRIITFKSANEAVFVACLLNSSFFYWYYSVFSDCEHVNDVLLRKFMIPHDIFRYEWGILGRHLMKRLEETAFRKTIRTKQGHIIQYDEMKAVNAKPIIDEIDSALAKHYGLTDEELDFITNYDIKYRLGADSADINE